MIDLSQILMVIDQIVPLFMNEGLLNIFSFLTNILTILSGGGTTG
jgi:hypothetical protein